MASIAEQIQKQVEYYFSDVNLSRDVFLKTKMSETADGAVPIDVLLTFNRLNALTKEAKVIAEALKGSTSVCVDEAALTVRRTAPLPESIQVDEQTIYVKPVPANMTLEELKEFFGQHGTVLAIWRRYFPGAKDSNPESRTKPSLFVVFGSVEEAKKFVAAPPTLRDAQLTAQMKNEYLAEKASQAAARNKDRKRGREETDAEGAPAATSSSAHRTPAMPTESSYRVAGVGAVERFSDLKGLWPVEEQKGIRYVFTPAEADPVLVFQDAETAGKMVASLQTRAPTLNGTQPQLVKLEGEEEKVLLEKVDSEIAERAAAHMRNGGGRGGRGGRGGPWGSRRPWPWREPLS